MKIQELNLTAFGPFSGQALVFDAGSASAEGGLHIVYGPNEAGKSSALRGLKALLYGIEERTPDNFVHANDKLRISGCLRNAEGLELAFTRRKGRKNTLLSEGGDVLGEQALSPFLQGVSAVLFETLFGIDHQALLQGGQEILEQKGEVGQALFSAALGSHALHAVLDQLDDEANGLFRPAGSKPMINAALKSLAALKRDIKACSLSSREWDEHRSALGKTSKELVKIQSKLSRNRLEVNRLQRIQRVLPKLARRRKLLEEHAPLEGVVVLPDNFAERHLQAIGALDTAQAMLGKAAPRLARIQQQLDGLFVRQDLLERAEKLEDIHARLGGHRKALQDRPHLEAQRQQLRADAEYLLKEVRPDLDLGQFETLRPVLARRQSITELGNEKAVLVSRVEQAESSRYETERRLKDAVDAGREHPLAGCSKALRRAIVAARKPGDMDAAIQLAQSDLATLQRQCAAGLSRLSLWSGELDDLPGLAVPEREGISYFEQAIDEHEQRYRRLEEKREEADDELRSASLRLDAIQRAGAVPTEQDLEQARADRDQVWRQLRGQWMDGEEGSAAVRALEADAGAGIDTGGALADTFEARLGNTDELSDRLRHEADRVHEIASLQAKQHAVQQQSLELAGRLEACVADKHQMDSEWQALWAPNHMQPRTPREMRAWLDELGKLREQLEQLNRQRQGADELERTRKAHLQWLNRELVALGQDCSKSEALETVLLECESFAQHLDDIEQQGDLLAREIKDLETRLATLVGDHRLAVERRDAWTRQWQALMTSLGLQDDTSPAEAADLIERVRELFTKQAETEALQIRISAIDDDAEVFRAEVADTIAELTPDLASELARQSAEDAIVRLNVLLSDNRDRKIKRQQIADQREQLQLDIQDAEATIQAMTDRLDSLCKEAGCGAHTQLEEASQKSTHILELRAWIEAGEREILEAGEGASVADLEAQTAGIDPDSLPGQIEALSHKIDAELEPRRTELAQIRGREEKELELMDGGDQAAELADKAQALLAAIRSDAERYVRVKLAGRVLRDEIERYRKENQGPLVKRASEHFTALTLGSFEGLMTDFNDKDEPILAGVRPSGERLTVEGMSTGTRDQLYLALRLASLEKYMDSAEPMPFIVDDILVDFDDRRSEAALKALAVLADKMQVIVFTHHRQLVEQARNLPVSAQVHEL